MLKKSKKPLENKKKGRSDKEQQKKERK